MANRPLPGFLDTSVLVRYLSGVPPEQAAEATRIIDRPDRLIISAVALAETAFVLTSVYGAAREEVVDRLMEFLRKRNIDTYGLDKAYVLQGLMLCRPSGRVSFADSMIWAEARSSGQNVVYSFDQRFPSDGIEVRAGL